MKEPLALHRKSANLLWQFSYFKFLLSLFIFHTFKPISLSIFSKGDTLTWQLQLLFYGSSFFGGIILFKTLLLLSKSNLSVRKYFHIPARKSATNAIQYGGLPLALTLWLSCFALSFVPHLPESWQSLIHVFLMTSPLVILYGYLDDKYEIRPIFKLFFQFTVILWASLKYSWLIYPENSAVFFLVTSFVGMGVLNGANLLDGLDTLTIKVHTVSFATFIAFGVWTANPFLSIVSAIFLFSLWSFFPFNKEPARIHLGEIGGPFLGFSQLLLACGFFLDQKVSATTSHFNAYCLAILPLTLPMIELSISFLRRLYNKKSPFSGDKLHVHHLLCHYFGHTPSRAASLMGLTYGATVLVTFSLCMFAIPFFIVFAIQVLIQSSLYFWVGKKHWKGSDTLEISARSLFDYIRKKDVTILEASVFDSFEFQILREEEVEHKLHAQNHQDGELNPEVELDDSSDDADKSGRDAA